MTLLDVDVGDAVEPKVMPAGEECKLRIVGASITTSDKGTFLIPRLEVTDEPYAKEFTHVLTIPEDDMDEKRLNQCKYRLDEFYRTFEFSLPQVDTSQRMLFQAVKAGRSSGSGRAMSTESRTPSGSSCLRSKQTT